ncbi:hypothetical protein [Nitratireductor thuwali]|uniref:Secreted protein n=1 Tax=Nitratireductor thuwali TaxID=2267699 RepID=A0ABY5MSM4_9HYPH|nr:hypothetical protein NTH_04359 [Nitratireductor thuwali]
MRTILGRTILLAVVGFVAVPAAATAQEGIPACQDQQNLEQVLGSNGEIMPEDCREATISVLETDGDRLCLVDLSGESEGIVGEIRDVAVEQRWWMSCQDIEEAVR